MDVRGIVLLCCLTGAIAAPLSSSNQCDRKCIAPSGFIKGRTYVYSYETEMATFIQQEAYGYSNLTINCVVKLEVIGNCEIVLELSDISAHETNRDGSTITSPNEESFREHLTRNRLRFGMQAGEVTSVCPPDEAVWVTNFKRGVLSAVQLTQPTQMHEWETVTESTVSGKCPTYLFSEEEGRLTKSKDFTKCEGRYNMNAIIPGIKLAPYAPSTDAITSQQHCRQEHNGDYMTYSECRERHTLFPISEPPTGPITTVIQRLTFDRIIKAPSNHMLESIGERKSILFEKPDHMEEGKTDATRANGLISDLCQSLSVGVDSDTARLYTAVIHEMRRLDSVTLANVFAVAAVSCDGYQDSLTELLSDALRDCKSTGCVEVMVNLIKDNTIEDNEVITGWISSLAFANHPTKEMVSHLMELRELETIRKPLFLTVTSIIKNYCTHVNENCEDDQEISEAVTEFENQLGSRCRYQTMEEKRQMLFSLRVLGNAGIYRRSIKKCYESENTDISLRVAAMQAVQQMPCKSKDREGLISILKKASQDSELRISAYKALMSCPSQEILDVIDDLLEDEMSNQVGGYIVSHLKGIQASEDPLKAEQRALLQDHQITAKFLDDPTKFSQNAQWSWYNETTGYGLGAEGDVIFSSQSFIPRQLGVKGRFDAFGYAFEAFELGGRVEGLQGVLESAFGFKEKDEDEENNRNRRSLIKENKLENIIEDFVLTGDGEPDGHIYLKMFDREVFFLDAEDIKEMMAPKTPEDNLIKLAMWSVGQTYEASNGQVVAEHKLSIPLVNGLEMKVSVNASSIERIKVTGKLDILSMLMDPRSLEIDGTIEPSGSFDMSCMMEVDAHCARIGTNYELSAHTATTISGKIAFEDGKNLKLQLRAPEQKQELLSVSSKVYFIHQEEKDIIPMSSLPAMQETVCTGDYLKDAIGIQVCGESMYHVDEYGMAPLSGAYEFVLTAENVEGDSTIFDVEASYALDRQMVNEDVEDTDMFHLMIGVRDAQRTYIVDWTFNRQTRQFTAELDCPYITSQLEVSSIREDNHKRLDVTYTVNEDSVYSMYLDFQRSTEDNGDSNFYPTMRMSTPQFGILELVGSVLNTDSVLRLDVSLQGKTRRFITVNGDINKIKGNKKSFYNTNLSIGGEYMGAASISSQVQVKDQVVTVDATLSKDCLFGTRSLTISGKHSSRGTEDVNHDFFLSCEFSHSPQSNFRFDGELQGEGLDSHSDFKFCYGQTSCSGAQKLLLSHRMTVERTENGPLTNSLTVTLQHPIQGTHLVFNQEMLVDDALKDFSIRVIDERLSPAAILVGSQVRLIHDENDEGRFGSFEVSLSTPGSIKRLNQTWHRLSSEVNAVTTVQWQEDQQIVASVSYSKPTDSHDLLSCSLTLPDMSTHKLVHNCSRYDKSHVEQMIITSDGQSVFSMEFMGNRASRDACMESWSLTVSTPFHVLSDFKLDFMQDKSDESGLNSTVAFTLLPDGGSYSLNVAGKKEQQAATTKTTGGVIISAPSSTAALKVFVEDKGQEFKTGLFLTTLNDGSDEKIFGIEAKIADQSDDTDTTIIVRVNTTTPSHEKTLKQAEKAIDLTASLQDEGFYCSLDIEYQAGEHAVTAVSLEKKANDAGFVFHTSVNAPLHRGAITLDHSKTKGSIFNPHLTIQAASPEFDMTLLDVNFSLMTSESIYGKDHRLELQVSGPDKTVIFTTGLERKSGGFDYFIQVANQEEIRLRIDLDTYIQVEGSFRSHIGLTASSIYAPEWPISCGITMGKGDEGIGGILFFDVNEENLFHLNVTKNVTNDLPMVLDKQNIAVRVKLPTSVIPSLHHFGMSILKEESLSQPDYLPIKSNSLSFFWGPETDQQLTMSSVSSVQNTGDSLSVEGSLLLVQPLRTVHLLPEYNMDYSFSKEGPQVTMKLEFDHGDGSDGSSLEITHSEQDENGNVTLSTSATATLQGGKIFKVAHNMNCGQGGPVLGKLKFTMTDGDHEEEATLSYDARKLSDESLSRTFHLDFHHLPSELHATSLMGIDNNEETMDFTIESQCLVPNLEEPINLGITLTVDKVEKQLVFNGLGPVNDITLRANVFNMTSDTVSSYRLETNNDINGAKRPVNIQLNFNKDLLDVIFETNAGEHKLHSSYLNDSAIQTKLTKNNIVNAQHTISVLDPFTLYNLITWETSWPATIREAAWERIDAMKETRQRTLDKYQEILDAIQEESVTYMTLAMMRNEELLTQMNEIGAGLRERFGEIKENYHMQRETIKEKFEEFGQTAKTNLSPLMEEYDTMFEKVRSNLHQVRDHAAEMTDLYFEETRIHIEAKLLSVVSAVIEEYADVENTLMENLELDRKMVSDLKEEKLEHIKDRIDTEINWMRMRWEEAQGDVTRRWREFADVMTGLINVEELENMKLGFQLAPVSSDFVNLVSTVMDLHAEVTQELEELRAERDATRALKEQDLNSLRRMDENFEMVKNAPTFATRDVHLQLLGNFFESASWDFNEKMERLIEWAEEKTKGYKYLANIEDGKIEVWLYTDQRYDDLVSPPVNDPLGDLKVLGMRLAEDFPLIEDMRRFKSQLYNDSELIMAYFHDVAEVYYNENYNPSGSGMQLRDLWEWYGFINEAVYEMFATRVPSGEAMLMGNQHYRTFDGTHYAYAGKCSFLLAQDFLDNSFTIAVEYRRKDSQSGKFFTIISGEEAFEINEGRVFINNKPLELPYSTSEVLITRDSSTIHIKGSKKFEVWYDIVHDVFKVQVSIFYFGKTAGLFGNFNYEPNDDLVKSNNEVTERIDEFARSWEVGKKCDTHLDKSVTCPDSPSLPENIYCAEMFLDGLGAASTGHPAVDPEPFYKACVNSMCGKEFYEEKLEARCNVFQGYVEACKHQGLVWLDMPQECAWCPSSDGDSFPLIGGVTEVRGVDVVVILEQESCMEESGQEVRDLIRKIDAELGRGESPLTENRYGLVGFGGASSNNEPHVETIKGELFGTMESFVLRLEDLEFDGEGMGDIWGAIDMAMRYPFRAGVSKHIILMSCSKCTERSRSSKSLRLQRAMQETGVTFSVFINNSFKLVPKFERKEDNQIYGFDEGRVFTDKLAGAAHDSFKGDVSLHDHLIQPSNPCIRLATSTNGGVFSMVSMNSKAFKDVFALWLTKHSDAASTVWCECTMGRNGLPHSICYPWQI